MICNCDSRRNNRRKNRNNDINKIKRINYNSKYQLINNNKFGDNQYNLKGFENIGNSCYINSFLQILFHTPNFINNLKKEYENSYNKSSLIKNLIDLSETNNKKYLYSIQDYMKNISSNYGPFLQADSQNFGMDLLNEIIINIKGKENFSSDYENQNDNEIMVDLYKKDKYKNFINKYQKNEISIEKMFLINEYKIFYVSNQVSNIRFDSSFQIELSIQNNRNNYLDEYSLKDLLDFKFVTEFEQKQNMYNNSLENNNFIAKLCKLPEILIITISRTILEEKFKNQKIKFPKIIDILDYIDKDLINKKNTKYKLFGINEKSGNSKTSGHYYSYIYIDNKWYLFNDTETKQEEPNFASRNVVGLFYKELVDQ